MAEPQSNLDIERYLSAVERLLAFPDRERGQLVGELRERVDRRLAGH